MMLDAHAPFEALRPVWPAPRGVVACMTGRGSAHDPWQACDGRSGFNVGAHVGDDPSAVMRRRACVATHFGVHAHYLNQVHGTRVHVLSAPAQGEAVLPDADASCTTEVGQACAIMVADCLPVLACNRAGTWVGAAHAGWRGLAQGVLGELVAAHRHAMGAGASPADLLVWLGPCIGPAVFEVGAEVREAFLAEAGEREVIEACFAPAGQSDKWLANLSRLARLHLAREGVHAVYGNDGSAPWCTVSNPKRWFSYRRDQARLGSSGRMAAYIWRESASV